MHVLSQDKTPVQQPSDLFWKTYSYACIIDRRLTYIHSAVGEFPVSPLYMLIVFSSQNNNTLMFKQSSHYINTGKYIWQTQIHTYVAHAHAQTHIQYIVRECDVQVFKAVNAFIICSASGDSSSPYEWISVGLSVEFSLWHRHSYHSLGVPIKTHPCQESNSSPTILCSPTCTRTRTPWMCTRTHTTDRPQTQSGWRWWMVCITWLVI